MMMRVMGGWAMTGRGRPLRVQGQRVCAYARATAGSLRVG